MKKNFIRLSLIGLVAVICGIFSGCKYFMGVLETDSGFVQHFLSQKQAY